jgi:hypothetical protein
LDWIVEAHEQAVVAALNQNVSVAEIQSATKQRGYVRDANQSGKVTTPEMLEREKQIVRMAGNGINRFEPLVFPYRVSNGRCKKCFDNTTQLQICSCRQILFPKKRRLPKRKPRRSRNRN